MSDFISTLRGWNVYVSHCAEHDLEMTGCDYDKTADYLGKAADEIERLSAELEQVQEEHGEMNLANVKYEKCIEQLEAVLGYYADMNNHIAGEKMRC
jgi:hypothetical protein